MSHVLHYNNCMLMVEINYWVVNISNQPGPNKSDGCELSNYFLFCTLYVWELCLGHLACALYCTFVYFVHIFLASSLWTLCIPFGSFYLLFFFPLRVLFEHPVLHVLRLVCTTYILPAWHRMKFANCLCIIHLEVGTSWCFSAAMLTLFLVKEN